MSFNVCFYYTNLLYLSILFLGSRQISLAHYSFPNSTITYPIHKRLLNTSNIVNSTFVLRLTSFFTSELPY